MNSTERRSEVKATWVRLTREMEIPKVSRSDDSSGAFTTRPPGPGGAPPYQRGGDEEREVGVRPRSWNHQKVV